jgi:hypothetical protein
MKSTRCEACRRDKHEECDGTIPRNLDEASGPAFGLCLLPVPELRRVAQVSMMFVCAIGAEGGPSFADCTRRTGRRSAN